MIYEGGTAMWERRRLRRSPRSMISFLFLVAFLFALIQGFLFLEGNLRPALLAAAVMKADELATDAISKAVLQKAGSRIIYQDLIKIEKDEAGRIVMAQLNTMEINRFIAETATITMEVLMEFEEIPVRIPLGEVLGGFLVAAHGPEIPVRMIPVGRVNAVLNDSFEEAGINQTRHKIYVDIHAEVQVIVPFIGTTVEAVITVPITDAIYIGEVPDTVINLQLPSGFM